MLLSQLPLPDPDRLTPAEQHVLDKHPEWYTGVQLSMHVTNCTTWYLGLHLAGQSGATTVTAIRLDPGCANVIESHIEVAMAVVATMAILLPARVAARPGASPLPRLAPCPSLQTCVTSLPTCLR